MTRRIVSASLIITLIFLGVTIVQAQDDFPTDDDVNAIAKNLYCPVCPNTPLDVCETVACQDWRDEIKMQLSKGWTEEEVVAYFAEQYGERVLAEPERSGFTSLVWILPVVAVLLGAVIVGQALWSWRAGSQVRPFPTMKQSEVSAETLAKIEQELQDIS
jgi:cytochrome c-type biogenesis protein CcmH